MIWTIDNTNFKRVAILSLILYIIAADGASATIVTITMDDAHGNQYKYENFDKPTDSKYLIHNNYI